MADYTKLVLFLIIALAFVLSMGTSYALGRPAGFFAALVGVLGGSFVAFVLVLIAGYTMVEMCIKTWRLCSPWSDITTYQPLVYSVLATPAFSVAIFGGWYMSKEPSNPRVLPNSSTTASGSDSSNS